MADTPRPELQDPADGWLLEELLAARAGVVGAHPELAAWLTAVQRPAGVAELGGLPTVLRAFQAHHASPALPLPSAASSRDRPARSARSRRHRPTQVVVIAAAALVTLGGTAAAAYLGVLPGPVQDLASHLPGVQPATSHARPASPAHPTPGQGPSSSPSASASTTPPGRPPSPSPAVVSACTAYLSHTLSTSSPEYQALVAAAGKANRLTGYCNSTLHAAAQSSAKGQGKPTTAPSNKPSTPPGKPSSKPTNHGQSKPTASPSHKPHP